MFNKLFKVVVACLLAFSLCGAANFTSTHGKLKVSGGKILDKNNKEVILRGMSFFWYQWNEGSKFYTQSTVTSLANNWNVSIVRAALQTGDLAIAKNMMDWANSAGIYVIIDNHSHSAHNQTSNAQNFFRDVSAYAKQKGYTHVLYEIYNEPEKGVAWSTIKTYAQAVIPTIRANDPDGLIIVGTPAMSSDISSARKDPLTGNNNHNVLYTLHFYAGESGHGVLKPALEAAYCEEFPVFVSEWGNSPADGGIGKCDGSTMNKNNSNDWLSLLEAAKVSYVNWSVTDKCEDSGALTSSNVDGSLRPSGTYIKNIFKLNTGSSLSQVGLSAKIIDCSEPPPLPGPDGIINFNYAGNFANFASKEGADSSLQSNNWTLINTSANFTASYRVINIPEQGFYKLAFNFGSNNGGEISWSGDNISPGELEIGRTESLSKFKYTDFALVKLNGTETTLDLSIKTSSPNSVTARSIAFAKLDSLDSIKYEGEISTPIQNKIVSNKGWKYNNFENSFTFESNNSGYLAIYNLRGENKVAYEIETGTTNISLRGLPRGAYLAVYRQGSSFNKKIIYLK